LNASDGLASILPAKARILIIGVGNEYRRDDAVGLLVARRLKKLSLENVTVLESKGEHVDLMESWKGADAAIIVDAAFSDAKPGTIHCIDARTQEIPRGLFHFSTHAFSLGDAVELARAIDRLPPRIFVYGIEGERFDEGVGLSGAVEESVGALVELVLKLVGALDGR
jgi:hydrogenase maturation protease